MQCAAWCGGVHHHRIEISILGTLCTVFESERERVSQKNGTETARLSKSLLFAHRDEREEMIPCVPPVWRCAQPPHHSRTGGISEGARGEGGGRVRMGGFTSHD